MILIEISEFLQDMFKADVSEDSGRGVQLIRNSGDGFSDHVRSLDKSVQVNVEEMCGSRNLHNAVTDTVENGNFKEGDSLVSSLASQSGSSSLDLHLSSESKDHSDKSAQDSTSTNLNKVSSEDCCPPESSSSSILSENLARVTTPSSGCENSPDMFENSQEECSQDQFVNSLPSNTLSTSSEVLADDLTGSNLSPADNRETLEEWNSQDLSDVSKSLKVRRKQIKRLIAAVIRKRQMEDETLDAFKKRLKRL